MLLNANIQVYLAYSELKDALVKYCSKHGYSQGECITWVWNKMLKSNNYSLSVSLMHDDSQGGRKKQLEKMLNISLPFELIKRVDDLIQQLKDSGSSINRSLFTQEGIRRYLEQKLIMEGFLHNTVFKDRSVAASNLKIFRSLLKLTQKEFFDRYLIIGGEKQISYSQYSLLERTGKGNIERLLEIISDRFGIDKNSFFDEQPVFLEYITKII